MASRIVLLLLTLMLVACNRDSGANLQTDKDNEKTKLEALAQLVEKDIDTVGASEIDANMKKVHVALDAVKQAIANIRSGMATLKKDASIRPMTCGLAYTTIENDFKSKIELAGTLPFGYGLGIFMDSGGSVAKEVAGFPDFSSEMKKHINDYRNGIKQRRFDEVPATSPEKAEAALAKLQNSIDAAQSELPNWKATVESVTKEAAKLDEDARQTIRGAQSQVKCKQ